MPFKNHEEYLAWARADYKKHSEARKADKKRYRKTIKGQRSYRQGQYKLKYGITIEDYDVLYKQQNGLCAICQSPPPPETHLYVDHDHNTGKVRGLLCSRCNLTIGGFEDSQELLLKAADYLGRSM